MGGIACSGKVTKYFGHRISQWLFDHAKVGGAPGFIHSLYISTFFVCILILILPDAVAQASNGVTGVSLLGRVAIVAPEEILVDTWVTYGAVIVFKEALLYRTRYSSPADVDRWLNIFPQHVQRRFDLCGLVST